MSELPQEFSIAPGGDFVLPFDIAKAGVRGRLVRLDLSSTRALSAHALPEAASRVAGEMLALGVLLGTALKLDGRLSVQTKSDGPLDLVMADYYGSEPGEDDGARSRGVRGFARLDAARFAQLKDPKFATLVGKGSMAITIEPKIGGQTYQGIVGLSEDGIAASAETYFAQSEQLPTVLRLAAAPLYVAGEKQPRWRAAGIMLQMTPESAKPGAAPEDVLDSDDWQRLSLILKTVAAVPRRRSAGATGAAGGFPLRLRAGTHRRGAAILCPGRTRQPGRSRRCDTRALRILRHDA